MENTNESSQSFFGFWTSERGVVLLSSYFLISVMSIFSLALFTRSNGFMQTTERNKNRIAAFNMAEAGIDSVIAALQGSPGNSGSVNYTAPANSTAPGGFTASYNQVVPKRYRIQAAGFAPDNSAATRAQESRAVEAYVELDNAPFKYAAFGKVAVNFNGNTSTDGYDSTDPTIVSGGDVASDGAVALNGNAVIQGDVFAETIQISGSNAQITGDANTEAGPGITCGPGSTNLASLGVLNVAGNNNYVMPAGTYHFDAISVTGNGRITTEGAVTVYVSGTVNIAGNGVTTAGNFPPNFIIIATDDESVSVGGNGNFHGGVYAPHSLVTTSGNGSFYGAIIAHQYNANGNGNLHYDVQMSGVNAPCSSVNLLSWREIATVAGS
jgi:hypothetical protein